MSYFRPAEFTCSCGCGRNEMRPEFVALLDNLRGVVGFPLIVTSGYRCPAHNCDVSCTGLMGPHTTGQAVDLAVSRHRAHAVLYHALVLGFTGIGLKQKGGGRFIHLDTLTEPDHAPRPTVWSY